MSNQITRRRIVRWLVDHGFSELEPKPGGHRYFSNGSIKVTIPAHGPLEMSRRHVGTIVREVERAGFDRREVVRELRSGEWHG